MVPKDVSTGRADSDHGCADHRDRSRGMVGRARSPQGAPLGPVASAPRDRPPRPRGMPAHRPLVRTTGSARLFRRWHEGGARPSGPTAGARCRGSAPPWLEDDGGGLDDYSYERARCSGDHRGTRWTAIPVPSRARCHGRAVRSRPLRDHHPPSRSRSRGPRRLRLAPLPGRRKRPCRHLVHRAAV